MKTEVSTVTTKGQLVIPSKLRRKYSIKEGTQVAFVEEENRLILQPLTPQFIRSLRGSLSGEPSALKYLLEERKRDRELKNAPNYETHRSRLQCPNDLLRKPPRCRKGPRSHSPRRRRQTPIIDVRGELGRSVLLHMARQRPRRRPKGHRGHRPTPSRDHRR